MVSVRLDRAYGPSGVCLPTAKAVGFPPTPILVRVPPPPLTAGERRAAQDKAVAARRLRLELKEKLKAGSICLAELLEQSASDEMVARMKVVSALESLPGLGKVKARRLMEEIGISETRRLKGLGARQKGRLLAVCGPGPRCKGAVG